MVIQVKHLDKMYKLYKPSDRLRETLGFKVRSEHYALRDVNFQVERGETVGIIGTNGSGKSTILKIITGVLEPYGRRGEGGRKISPLLELGAGFNMEYTGIENVYLNGTMMGIFQRRGGCQTSGYPGLRRYRRFCLSACKILFQRYVCPSGICSCH